ncbi:AHH domain-containing protein [Microbulbifer sp. MCCC 1A16149]|uniref:AHH domain-containing protein n=1 Tax=Microbulbifer sp. MCCC 1A16149 TaxID=3411322 RepID=UPI003D0A53BC
MGERFEQPRAPEAPPKYATPFEMAVYEYEKLAHSYHKSRADSARKNESEKSRKQREAEWEATRLHLKKERIRLKSMAGLQAELDAYRAEAAGKSEMALAKEKHHPTRKLEKNMAAADEPKPSPAHVAHHIIPGKGRWIQAAILDVRLSLHEHGVGINDPLNGIYLPDNKDSRHHWATPKAPVHKELHCWNYEHWIVGALPDTLKKNAFMNRLSVIKRQLREGTHPPEIVQKKDANWKPKYNGF